MILLTPRDLSDGLTRVFLHSGYSLEAVDSPLVRYSVAGKQAITLSGNNLYESTDVVVRFVAASQTVDVLGQVDLAHGKVSAITGAWATPDDWYEPCLAPWISAPLLGTLLLSFPTLHPIGPCVSTLRLPCGSSVMYLGSL